jgi:hypothetical protein
VGIQNVRSNLFSALANPILSQGLKRVMGRDHSLIPSLLLSAAVFAAVGAAAPAQSQGAQSQEALSQGNETLAVAQTTAESATGRYLFGQAPQPDQIGQGYVVLERSGDQVYGALYFPSSSFDCFTGQVQGTQLAMTIFNSYDQETYPYSLALAEGPAIAAGETVSDSVPFNLSGFYAIDNLSDNDHRILAMCRSSLNIEP